MIEKLGPRITFANVTALLALSVALGGVTIAAIPGKGGKINACYSKKTGAVRVVDSEAKRGPKIRRKCRRGERKIAWNQQGMPGPTGTIGPAGPAGDPASINGVAAGGDLTGTYPNPTIGGGTLDGSELTDGAVSGAKIANGGITGAHVDESTLGSVPAATNATQLEGLGAASFLRSSRILYGEANGESTTAQTVISWPELGLEVLNDGNSDQSAEIRVRLTGSANWVVLRPHDTTGTTFVSGNSTSGELGAADPQGLNHFVVYRVGGGATGGAVTVDCFFVNDDIRCLGVTSR